MWPVWLIFRAQSHKKQLERARRARTPPASRDQENVDPTPMQQGIEHLKALVFAFQGEIGTQKGKTVEARGRCQNTRRREERAHTSNLVLQDRLTCKEAIEDELIATQLSLTDSQDRIELLIARNSTLTQRQRLLVNTVSKVKNTSNVFKLRNKGLISETSRELVTNLVALHNVPVLKVLGVIKTVAQTVGVTVDGNISEHNQKKLARGAGGTGGWKEECDRKLRGEKELHSWNQEDLLPFIMDATAKKVADAGGIEAFNALPLAEQDTLNKSMFIDVYVKVGKNGFNAKSPEEQPTGGTSAAKAWAEALSEGGGVKLTSLAGMLFPHKNKKKGEGALFHIWFENALGYDITFPDTSNTRYQSHCGATGVLLLHRDLLLRYLEHMRDRKGNRHFTNVEKNVYDGLQDARTETELAVLPAYGQSLSRQYISQARGKDCEEKSLLALGPLHEQVKAVCRAVVADPDVILGSDALWVTASMDGTPWDNPELLSHAKMFFPDSGNVSLRSLEGPWSHGNISRRIMLRALLWLPTTNDLNEGGLGELRTGSRHAPDMTLEQHNARKMYKRNNTKKYRTLLLTKSFHIIQANARMVDSRGLTKQRRTAQQTSDNAAVDQKHSNDVKKTAKQKAVNDVLDKINPGTTEARVTHNPETGGEPTNKDLDEQLAWHRRAEKPW
ncbi:hypothetical protein DFH09DRAFT_1069447 [Mycena vulgaris]|nr:hypothetical protein DFH09DRAFT_1069447 [Mycena vulgaris]